MKKPIYIHEDKPVKQMPYVQTVVVLIFLCLLFAAIKTCNTPNPVVEQSEINIL